jgi:hypothetical protein
VDATADDRAITERFRDCPERELTMRYFRLIPAAICVTLGIALFTTTAMGAVPSVELASSANPSVFGQRIVLTGTVTDPTRPSSQTTGTMTFSDEEAWLGTAEVRNGKASLSDSAIDAGNDPITATFAPTGGGPEVASAPLAQVVSPAGTTTNLASSRPSAEYGQAGNVTATVKPVAPATTKATGSVDFSIDGGFFLTAPVNTLGKAILPLSFIYSALAPGTHSITASYSGNADYNRSTTTASLAQTLVGITATPVSTISLDIKSRPEFSPSSFTLSYESPVGCNVTITNNTTQGFALLYGTPGSWKVLPGAFVGAGASKGVGVGLAHFTGYFSIKGAANHITIKCM